MANKNKEDKYTKPELREKLKEEIKQSDKGGKKGQWSARKSQLLVQAYEKQGGGYETNKKDKAAKSLDEWSAQNWQTKEGKTNARQKGKTKRYLPEEVWNKLSEKEKKEAEQTKEKASAKGKQHIPWTPAVKRAMKEAGYQPDDEGASKKDLYEEAKKLDVKGRSKMSKEELQKAIHNAKK